MGTSIILLEKWIFLDLLLIMTQTCSMGKRFGDWGGHGKKLTLTSAEQSIECLAKMGAGITYLAGKVDPPQSSPHNDPNILDGQTIRRLGWP